MSKGSWDRRSGCPTHCFTLIIVRDPGTGKYLAVEETKNRGWWLPGGFVECGDDHYTTAHKETLEEGGILIDLKGVLRMESSMTKYGARQRVIFFAHPQKDQTPKQLPGDEESKQAQWMSYDEMLEKEGLSPPHGWRGSELLDWAKYLDNGGPIYPLEVLQYEGSDMPSHKNTVSYALDANADKASWFQFAQEGNTEAMQMALDINPDLLEARDKKKWTAACHAARYLHVDAMKFLIKSGCDIGSSTHKRRTPLHLAAQHSSEATEMVRLLLDAGASPLAMDVEKKTVVDFASSEIVKEFKW